jgi:hypothetical protein
LRPQATRLGFLGAELASVLHFIGDRLHLADALHDQAGRLELRRLVGNEPLIDLPEAGRKPKREPRAGPPFTKM